MKNYHSVGKFCKYLAAFTLLVGSLAFSAPAFSKSASCPDLLVDAMALQKSYLNLYGTCMKYPSARCIAEVTRREKLYEEARAAYEACNT